MDKHREMMEKDLAKLGNESPTSSSCLEIKKKNDRMLLTNICNKRTLEIMSNDVAGEVSDYPVYQLGEQIVVDTSLGMWPAIFESYMEEYPKMIRYSLFPRKSSKEILVGQLDSVIPFPLSHIKSSINECRHRPEMMEALRDALVYAKDRIAQNAGISKQQHPVKEEFKISACTGPWCHPDRVICKCHQCMVNMAKKDAGCGTEKFCNKNCQKCRKIEDKYTDYSPTFCNQITIKNFPIDRYKSTYRGKWRGDGDNVYKNIVCTFAKLIGTSYTAFEESVVAIRLIPSWSHGKYSYELIIHFNTPLYLNKIIGHVRKKNFKSSDSILGNEEESFSVDEGATKNPDDSETSIGTGKPSRKRKFEAARQFGNENDEKESLGMINKMNMPKI